MRILLLIVASSVACAQPNFTTDSNIEVICEDSNYCYSKYEVETIVDTFISLAENPGDAARHFSESNLLLIIEPEKSIGRGLNGKELDGRHNMVTNNITIGYYDCISYSAFGHELIHDYYTVLFNINDHSDTGLFVNNCGGFRECELGAREREIMILTQKELCGF